MTKLNADNQTAIIDGHITGYDNVKVSDLTTPVSQIGFPQGHDRENTGAAIAQDEIEKDYANLGNKDD